jgi:hypothetical protein
MKLLDLRDGILKQGTPVAQIGAEGNSGAH